MLAPICGFFFQQPWMEEGLNRSHLQIVSWFDSIYMRKVFLFCSMCTLLSFLWEYLQLAYSFFYRSEIVFICLIFFNDKIQNQIETAGKIVYIYAQSNMQSCLLRAGAVISYSKANRQPVQNMPITHLCLQFIQSFA